MIHIYFHIRTLYISVTGNTFVLKPSEKDPGAAMMLGQMAHEAGLPNGVLNIVHGAKKSVSLIILENFYLFQFYAVSLGI